MGESRKDKQYFYCNKSFISAMRVGFLSKNQFICIISSTDMKDLPIGVQAFAFMRGKNTLYVDKTYYVHQLVTSEARYYFLSRPRRFGKSLLLSTLKAFFQGRQDLFEGLWIADKVSLWEEYPVLVFDFSLLDYQEQSLQQALVEDLISQAGDFDITLQGKAPKTMFKELIKKLKQKTGKNVVILVDEYDKPIHDFLEKPTLAEKNRQTLKNFYGIIKGMGENIRFCFLTGVSRFSRMSIFSDLNHLVDITLAENYAAMLGYTQDEVEAYFSEHLQAVAERREITIDELIPIVKKWYNGYSWDGTSFVYNPFSFMCFCKAKSFYNYWFETGTPTFLTKLLHKNFEYDFDELEVEQFGLSSTSIVDIDWKALLFQTGYITIKKITLLNERPQYILAYPNVEVRDALLQYLLMQYN
jgi:Predicted AAA-ATPase